MWSERIRVKKLLQTLRSCVRRGSFPQIKRSCGMMSCRSETGRWIYMTQHQLAEERGRNLHEYSSDFGDPSPAISRSCKFSKPVAYCDISTPVLLLPTHPMVTCCRLVPRTQHKNNTMLVKALRLAEHKIKWCTAVDANPGLHCDLDLVMLLTLSTSNCNASYRRAIFFFILCRKRCYILEIKRWVQDSRLTVF